MFNIKKISALLITSILLCSLTACGSTLEPPDNSLVSEPSSASAQPITIIDRDGKTITIPEHVDKIISMAPSVTETLVHLGLADKLVAVDKYSIDVEGVAKDLPVFDIMVPDTESIAALKPDIIFATGMSRADGDDPFKPVTDLGVLMTYIPSSNSIEDIKKDIIFIGEVTGTKDKTDTIIADMEKEIADILAAIGDNKLEKSVYFEIGAAPHMYSFGTGVFLDEIITLLGAENILADQESWVSVSEEWVLDKNPDIIFTNVNYVEDPVGEIMERPGWNVITAVKNRQVYSINRDASSRANEYITVAIREMAKALYPDLVQ